MSLNMSVPSGRILALEGENVTGLLTQSANGTTSMVATAGTPVAADVQVGNVFAFVIRCTGAGPDFSLFSKNSPWKWKVVDAWAINNAAGAAADTVKLQNGDGAASETFADITDAADANKSDKVVTRFATFDDAQTTVAAGGSLKAVTASSAPVDVHILGIRVK